MPTEIRTDPIIEILSQMPAEVTVGDIIDTVLDAADLEILEDLGEGPAGAAGPIGARARAEAERGVLLRELMVDFVARYCERQGWEAARGSAGR